VDLAAAHAHQTALFRVGRAAGREQHRNIAAPAVDQAANRVRSADIDMHHHRLRPPRLEEITLRHGDGDVLVRHGDGLGHFRAVRLRLRVGLDQRREIGTGIGEEVIDAAVGEQRKIGVGNRSRLDDLCGQEEAPVRLCCSCHGAAA
jgi:hypothetical protein